MKIGIHLRAAIGAIFLIAFSISTNAFAAPKIIYGPFDYAGAWSACKAFANGKANCNQSYDAVYISECKTYDGKGTVLWWCGSQAQVAVHWFQYTYNCPAGTSRDVNSGRCIPNNQKNSGGNGPNSCNPVNLYSGNKYFSFTERLFSGLYGLNFNYSYNSDLNIWSYSFSQKLSFSDDRQEVIKYTDETGAAAYFYKSIPVFIGDGSVAPPPSYHSNNRNDYYLYKDFGSWELRKPDGSVEKFNLDGSLNKIAFPNGIEYDINNIENTRQIITPGGTVEIITQGLNDLILLDQQLIFTLEKDSSNRISIVRYTENGGSIQFAGSPRITSVVDERSRSFKNVAYYGNGKVQKSIVGNTHVESFEFLSNNITRYTNPFGKKAEMAFDLYNGSARIRSNTGLASTNCAASNEYYSYDTNGFKDKVTDAKGNVTDYNYSTSGLVTKITEGLRWTDGTRTSTTTTPDTRITEQDWNATSRQLVEVRAPGLTTHYAYWPNNRLKQVTQTDTTSQTNVFGSTQGLQRITSYSYTYYNGTGLPFDVLVDSLTVDGPLPGTSDTTIYKYDLQGRLLSTTNAAGQAQQFANFDSRGQPQTTTDANGVVTELGYHSRGWLETVTVKDPANNTALDAVTSYAWYPNGTLEQLTFPDGSFLHYEYNDARHLIEIQNNLGEKVTFSPNAVGEWVESRTYDTSATMKRLQTRAFDELGRLMDLFGNHGQHTHYGYDTNNNLGTIVENGDNRTLTTSMNYDTLDRLKEVLKPVTTEQNGTPSTVNVNTSYGYDGASNLTSVTDPKGNITSYIYNGFGDKIQQTSPDTGVTQYWYNAQGSLSDQQDARGVHVQYHYDTLGRLAWIEYPSVSDDIHYYYDEISSDNPYAKGRLTRVTDGTGSTQYRYDHRGNITRNTRTLDDQTFITEYRYNLANNLTGITYPGGRIVSYTRGDALGRITGLTTRKSGSEPEQTVLTNVTYLPFGPLTQFNYGNGLTRQVPYDLDYRIDQITVSGSVTPLNLDYGYDAFNNITSILNGVDNGRSETFAYDDLHRLQHAYGFYINGTNPIDHIRYEYDPVGNRASRELSLGGIQQSSESYSYNSLSNQLDSISRTAGGTTQVRSLQYSDAGNLESETNFDGINKTYAYNDNNRLINLSENSLEKGEYQHNALGERVKKTSNGATVHYLYGLQGELLAEADANGTIIRNYLYLNGQMVGAIDVTN